ncbi:MAG TPA: amino acid ABC transporter substrate-binding protein, partial [Thermodesulfobacteriota bacterium]
AYDQIQLVALAIEAAGTASGEAINRTMRQLSGPDGVVVINFEEGAKRLREGQRINYEGASGPIDFDEHGNISRGNFSVAKVEQGRIVETGETITVSLR